MTNFYRVASLIKIGVFESVAVFFLGGAFGVWLQSHGGFGCPSSGEPLDSYFFGELALGSLAWIWLIRRILWPKVIAETLIFKTLAPSVTYPFLSTHPSYVFVDLIPLALAAVLYYISAGEEDCTFLFERASHSAWLVLAAGIPILRLFSWHVLKRQPATDVPTGGWKPVGILYAMLSPVIVMLLFLQISNVVQLRHTAVVDENALAGGLGEHPELVGKFVHLKGVQKLPQPIKVMLHDYYEFAVVLVDMGEGGEVVVYSNDTADKRTLAKKTTDNLGKPIDMYGTLWPLPEPGEGPNGGGSVIPRLDQFGPPPPHGRALLELTAGQGDETKKPHY
jgi:hypothetical protein